MMKIGILFLIFAGLQLTLGHENNDHVPSGFYSIKGLGIVHNVYFYGVTTANHRFRIPNRDSFDLFMKAYILKSKIYISGVPGEHPNFSIGED